MYLRFFGLQQEPFSIAPDPRYLFMSERHREALAHLLYGLGAGGGFVLLTGEIGAGKTTVCRCFLEQVPRRCNVAYIFNPKLSAVELLKTVCDEFGVPTGGEGGGGGLSVKDHVDPLNEYLLRTHAVGQDNVLIVDEAQNVDGDVLEQLRLLTNLETAQKKLLQIILIGQPELRQRLAEPQHEQLAQRVIARYHLEALSAAETGQYVAHRMAVAGHTGALPFDVGALRSIHRRSGGVPRRINLLCDRALLGAYASGTARVTRRIVGKAAREVFGPALGARRGWRRGLLSARLLAGPLRRRSVQVGLAAAAGAALAGSAVFVLERERRGGDVVAGAPVAASAEAERRRPVVAAPGRPAIAVSSAAVPSAAAAGSTPAATLAAAPAAAPGSAAASAAVSAVDLPERVAAAARDEKQAWRDLAPLWKVALTPADADPCAVAEQQHVHCFRSANTSLALIRQLGRPGILTLRDARNESLYAVLTGLGPATASLRIGGVAETLPLARLAQRWRGDFATLWRVPPGYVKRVVDADSGVAADWLATRLASIEGLEGADAPWRSRVAAFQRAQGLQADGLAGPTTFMQLNRATGVDEPRLAADGSGDGRP